jgi:predicted acylesterase/phospholipase RssA
MENDSESVFDRIALSLSGGGFRAAAYSLGTLNALYLLGLLDKVHMLSTASGGTLTGVFYAARRKQGEGFATIYEAAYDWLKKDEVLPTALKNWRQAIDQRQVNVKLIHAFANAYDEKLYEAQQFGIFWKPMPSQPLFHLQSIIFGATELYSGLTFRFQYAALLPADGFTVDRTKQQSYYIGNGNVYLTQADAQLLRLGDVAAASSCFPVGFEPLVLPDDFRAAPDQPLGVSSRFGKKGPEKIALIDGGVYDNQGIESLLQANKRNATYCQSEEFRAAKHSPEQQALLKPTSLFLVADVDAASTDLYDATKPVFTSDNWPSLGRWVGGVAGVVVALLVAGGLLVGRGQGGFWAGALVMLGVLSAVALLLGWWGWRKLATLLRALDERIYQLGVPTFLRLTLGQWRKLLAVRVRTASVLLQSVFTRRVRSQNYNALYNRDEPASRAPIVASIIGGLVRDYPQLRDPQWIKEVDCVRSTVQAASEMSTTLWWGRDSARLPAIVASAGLTLCYRLLRYFQKNPPATDQDREVARRAKLLWQAYVTSAGQVVLGPAVLGELTNPACTATALLADQASSSLNPSHPAPQAPCLP